MLLPALLRKVVQVPASAPGGGTPAVIVYV